jgi:hypothetical protein
MTKWLMERGDAMFWISGESEEVKKNVSETIWLNTFSRFT